MPFNENVVTCQSVEVIRTGVIDMQVCVPIDWTDDDILRYANTANPAGTQNGWQIRTDPDLLAGCPVRNPCATVAGRVHVTLDC